MVSATLNIGIDIEEMEFSNTASRNIKLYNCYEKQFDHFVKS